MSANAHHCWGVVTKSKGKGLSIIDSIKEEQKLQGNNWVKELYDDCGKTVYFENGFCVRAFPPIENFRGYRFHRLWCDKDIDQDYLGQVILPMACYMKYEDIIWI